MKERKYVFLLLIITNLLTAMICLVVFHPAHDHPEFCTPTFIVQNDTTPTFPPTVDGAPTVYRAPTVGRASTVNRAPTVDRVEEKEFEKRCISYTVYQPSEAGVSPMYTQGFLHNVEIAKLLYPLWRIKLYLDIRMNGSDFHKSVTEYKEKVDIIWMKNNAKGHGGHMWRFLVADREDCDRWIVRDTDSRLSIRTMQATNEWIWSRRSFHIMRDHILHDGEILAGLFGGVKGCLGDARMEDLIKQYNSNPQNDPNDFGADQKFLARIVFPRIRYSFMVHDDYLDRHSTCKNYGHCRKFPVKDMPFFIRWGANETLDCSCKARCICEEGKCPLNKLVNGGPPTCMT